MDNKNFFQNSISHKELNSYLIKAKKDIDLISNNSPDNAFTEEQEFNKLVEDWSETSKKLLLMINNNQNKIFSEKRNPKSLMALGAMGVHINMALQALRATRSD